MGLRLIGGKFGSRTLKSPKGSATRPTSAILRKAVFDISREILPGARFLDLFAGSGAMGMEALSRGAIRATFVEKDRQACHCIRENLNMLKIEDQSELYCGDAMTLLKKIISKQISFDIIYLDPPYASNLLPTILQAIDNHLLLSATGVVFIEEAFPSKLDFPSLELRCLRLKDSRRFGNSLLHQLYKNFIAD